MNDEKEKEYKVAWDGTKGQSLSRITPMRDDQIATAKNQRVRRHTQDRKPRITIRADNTMPKKPKKPNKPKAKPVHRCLQRNTEGNACQRSVSKEGDFCSYHNGKTLGGETWQDRTQFTCGQTTSKKGHPCKRWVPFKDGRCSYHDNTCSDPCGEFTADKPTITRKTPQAAPKAPEPEPAPNKPATKAKPSKHQQGPALVTLSPESELNAVIKVRGPAWSVLHFVQSLHPATVRDLKVETVSLQNSTVGLLCSFCECGTEGVPTLVQGPKANICSDCVTLCVQTIEDKP